MATEKLLSLDVYRHARSISVYLSMPKGEVMTGGIVKDALAQDKAVYVPYIVRQKQASAEDSVPQPRRARMDMVALHSLADFQQCEENRDKWGIPSISPASVAGRKRVLSSSDQV